MILIADSGSTKTDWCVAKDGFTVKRFTTQGINPYHQDERRINGIVLDELLPQTGEYKLKKIVFYGSGCRDETIPTMKNILYSAFNNNVEVEIYSDLLGAARAICGHEEGIACILGTGSNSCLYDGKKIVGNIPPLGYILGDEGSGATLGKMFINEIFKNSRMSDLKKEFLQVLQMTEGDIIDRVYRQPMANRFLASLAPFIHSHIERHEVNEIVTENFRQFLLKNVKRYHRDDLQVSFIGSIAWHFKSQLLQSALEENVYVGSVEKSPMDGLLRYHFR
ncbi:MAG: ATPase [Prevotella sp.]|nr:ATPase [Prevotella sp.]